MKHKIAFLNRPFAHRERPEVQCESKILCVGEAQNLLEYRALVLKCTGASIQTTNGTTAPRIIKRDAFSLIVVGYTVTDESARSVYEAAKARNPSPIVIRLWSWMRELGSDALKYADVVSSSDPATLVHIVTDCLKPQK